MNGSLWKGELYILFTMNTELECGFLLFPMVTMSLTGTYRPNVIECSPCACKLTTDDVSLWNA